MVAACRISKIVCAAFRLASTVDCTCTRRAVPSACACAAPEDLGAKKKNDNEEEEKQEYDCISWRWSKGVVGSEILCMLDRIHVQLVHAPVHLGQE